MARPDDRSDRDSAPPESAAAYVDPKTLPPVARGTVDSGKVRVEKRGLLGKKKVTARLERPEAKPERSMNTLPSIRRQAEGGDEAAKAALVRYEGLIAFMEAGEEEPVRDASAKLEQWEWLELSNQLALAVEELHHRELTRKERKEIEQRAIGLRRTLRANRSAAPEGFMDGRLEIHWMEVGLGSLRPVPQDVFDATTGERRVVEIPPSVAKPTKVEPPRATSWRPIAIGMVAVSAAIGGWIVASAGSSTVGAIESSAAVNASLPPVAATGSPMSTGAPTPLIATTGAATSDPAPPERSQRPRASSSAPSASLPPSATGGGTIVPIWPPEPTKSAPPKISATGAPSVVPSAPAASSKPWFDRKPD